MPPLAAYAPARVAEPSEVDEDGHGAARGVLKALVAQENLTPGEMKACLGLLEQGRVTAAEITMLAIAVVAVDALNDSAQRCYARYGFVPLDETSSGRRLFLPMATVRQSQD